MRKQSKNKKSISYYDTPFQRRHYGDWTVNIISFILGEKDSYKNNIGVESNLIVNNKNYGENNLENSNNK